MARRITISIKVEDPRDKYSWDTLAESELVSSIELFSPAAAAAAIVAGVEQLIGIADIESEARAAGPVFARRVPNGEHAYEAAADEAVPE